MLDKIIALKDRENSLKELRSAIRQGVPSAVFGVSDAFKNFIVSVLDGKVLYVVKDGLTANAAVTAITELSGKKAVYLPAREETLLYLRAFSKDTQYQRIKTLYEIPFADVIVVTADALMQPVPKSVRALSLIKDGEVSRETATEFLVQNGYERVETVEVKGTFAVRGDVLDVFPINAELPVRVDFFDDYIENIKTFDPETRKTVENIVECDVLQAREFTFCGDDVGYLLSLAKKEIDSAPKERVGRLKEIYDELTAAAENTDERLDPLAVLSCDRRYLFDLLDKETTVVFEEPKRVHEFATLCENEFRERYSALYLAGETFSFSEKNCLGAATVIERASKYTEVALQTLSTANPYFEPQKIINPKTGAIANYRLDFKEIFTDIGSWLYSGYAVLVCTGDVKRAENFSFELSGKDIASSLKNGALTGVTVTSEKLSAGFIFHEEKVAVVGSGNLFSTAVEKKTRKRRQSFFNAPETGDYCVHEVHGIGRVLGSARITTTEGTKDYVSVEYAGGDKLYVPVEQMDILTRYLGGEKKPKLSKIGGADFEKIKKAVKESIKKMSFDLKKLYRERESAEGFAFRTDGELERAFDTAFPYEETPDQIAADEDIKKDMESGKVMDRLICGDVGFGKTEVAYRAVFRAIVNGKQAAMLAPTTILTEQHFSNAVERFKNFGVKIAVLNRFRTAKEQKKIEEELKDGKIDFIIGTHKLLGKNVAFRDLGLLVLDEEQRFGVEHKEKIKLLKKNVDTLTLTATPIPRTLHMSLSGIRSISVINTPPKKRLPVQTFVTEETDALVKDVVMREINRGGQVFVMYNRVESIFSYAKTLKDLMPDVRFTVAHGRMDERALEKNIMDFYQGNTDVLVSTTIIENGIDLPRANTLVVIDADRLGLSSLYQLKGRVGRSDRLAYAYFTFKKDKILNATAYERLNAIIEFTEMGSGIKIAMRDLEIRGAGNILGAEQHGHMDKIGYELYSKLLREEITGKEEKTPELDIRINAYIPESYVEGNVARMDAYKEIAEINSSESEKDFIETYEQSYGEIPNEVLNLVNIAVVKYTAMKIGVKRITVTREESSLSFENFGAFRDEKLMAAMEEYKDSVMLEMATVPKIRFNARGKNNAEMLIFLREFLSKAV